MTKPKHLPKIEDLIPIILKADKPLILRTFYTEDPINRDYDGSGTSQSQITYIINGSSFCFNIFHDEEIDVKGRASENLRFIQERLSKEGCYIELERDKLLISRNQSRSPDQNTLSRITEQAEYDIAQQEPFKGRTKRELESDPTFKNAVNSVYEEYLADNRKLEVAQLRRRKK